MVELNIITGRKAHRYQVPESWEELDGRQLKHAMLYKVLNTQEYREKEARRILGVKRRVWRKIPPAQKCMMTEELLRFVFEETPSFRDNKIPVVRAGVRRLHGFDDMFSDMTWEEFIYADTFMLRKMYREMVTVLYRPANPLTGRKRPFSDKDLPRNSRRTDRLDETTVALLALNYRAVRKKAVEEMNGYLFPSMDETYMDGKRITLEEEEAQAPNQAAGWADTHHILMGDLAYEEEKFLKSKATTIVAWINRRIKESREAERKRKR